MQILHELVDELLADISRSRLQSPPGLLGETLRHATLGCLGVAPGDGCVGAGVAIQCALRAALEDPAETDRGCPLVGLTSARLQIERRIEAVLSYREGQHCVFVDELMAAPRGSPTRWSPGCTASYAGMAAPEPEAAEQAVP